MSGHVMGSPEGAALRIQLDGMIAALSGFDEAACEADDVPVIHLLASLYEARKAAKEIENRKAAPKIEAPPLPRRKGVRFAKQ